MTAETDTGVYCHWLKNREWTGVLRQSLPYYSGRELLLDELRVFVFTMWTAYWFHSLPLHASCVCVYQSVYWSIHCNSGTEEEEEGKSTINLVHYDCGWCSITTRQCSGSYFTQLLAVSLFIFFLWVSRSIQEYYFFKVMKMATCWYRHASTPCNNRTSKISLLQSIIMVFLFCMNLFTVYT